MQRWPNFLKTDTRHQFRRIFSGKPSYGSFQQQQQKGFFCDLLVQLGTYRDKNITDAHDAMMLLINGKDMEINDLNSLEVNDEVLSKGRSVILMSCPDAIKLLKRIGVRTFVGHTLVSSKDASLHRKKMRDVHMAGYSVDSDAIIHFCSRDHTVSVADMLVGVRRYDSYKNANRALLKLINSNDEKLEGLTSLIEDKTKFDTVST